MPRMRIGEMLVGARVLSESSLQAALIEQRRWGGPLGRILVDMGMVKEDVLVEALSRQLNLPLVQIGEQEIDRSVLELVPSELATQHNLVPFHRDGKFLDVAMSDPTNLGIVDELRIRTQLNVRPHLAGPRAIQKALSRWYGRAPLDVTGAPTSIRHDFHGYGDVIELDNRDRRREVAPTPYGKTPTRDEEITALQRRLSQLEALVARDEDVLRKLLALLVEKGFATREEILERIK